MSDRRRPEEKGGETRGPSRRSFTKALAAAAIAAPYKDQRFDYDATLAEGTVTTLSPLPAGKSVELQFYLGVVQPAQFRILVIVEALP